MAFGLHKAAKYYYYPGWHEPGTTLECFINKEAFMALPEDLQVIVRNALRVANQDMLAEFMTKNNQALDQLVNEHGVELRNFPDDVMKKLREISDQVVAEEAEKDEITKKVYDSFVAFRDQVQKWTAVSDQAYVNARSLS